MLKLWPYILGLTAFLIIVTWRVYPHKINLWHLLNLFLPTETFVDLSVKDAIKREYKSNAAFKERCEKDENYKSQRIAEFRAQFSESTHVLRTHIKSALTTVFFTLLCAVILAFSLSGLFTIPQGIVQGLQILSAFLILFAIVGQLGYSIETIGGQSLPETMDKYWYVIVNIGGMFLLFFSLFYGFFKKS